MLKPYHNQFEVQEKFNPRSYVSFPSAYSAAVNYLKQTYGEWAVNLFENVIRDNYKHKPITDEDLPQIAREMAKRGVLFGEDFVKNIVPHLTQIKNARIGGGDPRAFRSHRGCGGN